MTVLLDTSFLLAVAWAGDASHSVARAAMRELVGGRMVVAPVLPEVFYMVASRANYTSALNVFRLLSSPAFHIEPLTAVDMNRMQAIMAVAERLNIREIYTLDRRDFSIFRPSHCDFLTLLP